MLTLSALHNTPSSPVSPLKNSAPATDAQEAGRAATTAGFGEVLAHEMSGKDRSEAELPDEKTAPGKDRDGRVISIGEMKARNAEIKKDTEEKEGNVIVAAVALKPMNMTEVLPSLAAARTPGSRTDAGIEVRADVQADTQGNDPQGNDPADILASMFPAELATAAAQHAGLAASQFSPVIARSVGIPNNTGANIGTGIGTRAAMAAADAGASQNAKLSPDALTNVEAGVVARIATGAGQGGVSDPVIPDKTFVTRTFVTNDDASIKPSKDGRQGILPQLEFGSPKFRLADETQQLEKSMLDVAQHNLSAAQVDAGAGVSAAVPERGSISAALASVSASAAPAGTPVHAALGLEPRLGAAGWDNALGQKVLWMVSNQQQVAELSLNPPDLGPLQVVLSISDDQVSAMFISQQADVRQALEAALPRLKEMMADSGINLSNTTVSADSTRQQAESEQQNHSGARYGKGNSQMTVPGIDAGANPIRSGVSSLVDTFA